MRLTAQYSGIGGGSGSGSGNGDEPEPESQPYKITKTQINFFIMDLPKEERVPLEFPEDHRRHMCE